MNGPLDHGISLRTLSLVGDNLSRLCHEAFQFGTRVVGQWFWAIRIIIREGEATAMHTIEIR
jgi:hypothetical protein